jgi:hypothetical protein
MDSSDNVMVQYHALGLLYHIRKQDRLAITKLLAKLTKMSLKSPYAVILLIRIACKMIEEEDQDSPSPYFDFIESCLRHKVRHFRFFPLEIGVPTLPWSAGVVLDKKGKLKQEK